MSALDGLRVVAAAILHRNVGGTGRVFSVPPPGRHHDVIQLMVKEGIAPPIRGEQGFLLNNGLFVMRKPALRVAKHAEQLIREPTAPAHGLFSEDVW